MKKIVIMSLLLLGLALAPVALLAALAKNPQPTKQVEESAPQSGMAGCVSECKDCALECEKTLAYCLKQGGKHTEGKHIQALKDCIATCKLSHDLMSRSSALSGQACTLCAQACQSCAESCATFADKAMQECAEECRKCQQACLNMAK